MNNENELPMLAGIGAIIRWFEELASLLSGPVLTFGLAIALIDLFTDGKLLATTPALLFAWAASQTVGLDAQLVGSAAKLGAAIRKHAALPVIGYTLLVIALGYVAFQASNVFATQQAEGITTAQALARLGMDSARWIIERSALAVLLVILSGLLRYVAPAKVSASLADERAELERELELEPLRQRLRATQVGGMRSLAQLAVRGATQQAAEQPVTLPAAPIPAAGFEATEQAPTHTPEAAGAASPTTLDQPHLSAEAIIEQVKRELALTNYPPAPEPAPVPAPEREPEPTPPTDGGTPSFASKRTQESVTAPLADNVTPLRRGLGRAPRTPQRDRRVVNRANARGGKRGSAEQRVRRELASNPAIEFDELVTRAKVAPSTASKYIAVIEAEKQARRAAR